jgi:uncharacterized protein (DUF433 family)
LLDPDRDETRIRRVSDAGSFVTETEPMGRIRPRGGVPCIHSLRVPVATVVGMAADGMTTIDIPAAYPDLEREDIQEALHDAANAVRERELPLMAP